MNWGSTAEFFEMGGYAFFVWGSFGVAAAALVIETILLRKRRSSAIVELRREIAARSKNGS
jgi:heme exporter protein D